MNVKIKSLALAAFVTVTFNSQVAQSQEIPTIVQGEQQLELQIIATELASPVLAVSEPTSPDAIYVIELGGTVQKVDISTGEKELFLDFSNELVSNFGRNNGFDERGLLGFAFDPDYQNNSYVYTYISKNADGDADFSTLESGQQADHQTVISQWTIDNSQPIPAAINERELLIIDQPQFNHNGGSIVFGPDGNLFISLGDGGGANDVGNGHGDNGNGRDNSNPLGAILRIDPRVTDPVRGNNYGIPSDNPFVGQDGIVEEIYAYGFRNPYRFSIEALPNNDFNLYVGDVGQANVEEVDLITPSDVGGNYGWNYKEGSFFFSINANGSSSINENPPVGEDIPTLIDPIAEYGQSDGISVIGGHVYTGSESSALRNRYVFGDWSRSSNTPDGRIFYLNAENEIREFDYITRPNIFITGFGQDNQNELYVVGGQSSRVTGEPSGSLIKLIPRGGNSSEEPLCFPIKAQNNSIVTICL